MNTEVPTGIPASLEATFPGKTSADLVGGAELSPTHDSLSERISRVKDPVVRLVFEQNISYNEALEILDRRQ